MSSLCPSPSSAPEPTNTPPPASKNLLMSPLRPLIAGESARFGGVPMVGGGQPEAGGFRSQELSASFTFPWGTRFASVPQVSSDATISALYTDGDSTALSHAATF